jgi:hypothetical protein
LGKPLAFVLTEGERHESPVFEKLMKLGGVRRKEVGSPRFRPKFLAADRAYANHRVRGWLRRRKIRPVIPKGGREKKLPRRFEKELYKERNRIERLGLSTQAKLTYCHPLREDSGELSDYVDPRSHTVMALTLQTRPKRRSQVARC